MEKLLTVGVIVFVSLLLALIFAGVYSIVGALLDTGDSLPAAHWTPVEPPHPGLSCWALGTTGVYCEPATPSP
ncbi:MAG: hypothetical protein EHM35_00560 [Planctomycetaceae bacterium]|nr:MAG: hypothetical protein EHM35_00560 [Planctomycetaceae bacterium]